MEQVGKKMYSNDMKTEFEIYNPGGNITAIITTKLTAKEALIVSQEIMTQYPEVEQVAMILDVYNDVCTFKMVGGEFCGNACRCVAEFMRRNYGFGKSKLVINDIKLLGTSNNNESEITLNKSDLIEQVKNVNGNYCVFMKGITHIIIPNKGDVKLAIQIKSDYEKQNKIGDALGVMFLDNNSINPFVWVERAKTFFNETGCLSGSIAAAIFIGKNETTLTQPSWADYSITIKDNLITAKGPISFVAKNTLGKMNGSGGRI